MKQTFIIRNNGKHLLLFFAGWGMDETPFRHIHPAECDWMICYDYRSLEFDTTLIQAYSKISLIAWSMGVWAASQVMKQYPSLPVSQSTAINGTLYPIHETKGITPSVFEGTLQGLHRIRRGSFGDTRQEDLQSDGHGDADGSAYYRTQ